MYSIVLLTVLSFILCFLLTPLVRTIFGKLKLLDHPDRQRRFHTRPIPRGGGMAITLAYAATFTLFLCSPLRARSLLVDHLWLVCRLFPACLLIVATGLFDDLREMRPMHKLFGQIGGAILAYWAGVRILGVAAIPLDPWLSFPLTIFWLVACTNAFNLIDGMDGLAAGIGLFASTTILISALISHQVPLALATAPLAGCLAGFLFFNFNPASIFLGDSGSFLIGFLLGCFGVIWTQKSATVLSMVAPLMVLVIPLLDTSLSMLRRFLRGKPILSGDRGHIHHRLLARGMTPRRAALVLYGICCVAGFFSLMSVYHGRFAGPLLILFCLLLVAGVWSLGYAEFDIARRLLLSRSLRRSVDVHVSLLEVEQQLNAAVSIDECWTIIRDACCTAGFSYVQFSFAGEVFEQRFHQCPIDNCTHLRSWFSRSDFVAYEFESSYNINVSVIAPFVEVPRKVLTARAAELRPLTAVATSA